MKAVGEMVSALRELSISRVQLFGRNLPFPCWMGRVTLDEVVDIPETFRQPTGNVRGAGDLPQHRGPLFAFGWATFAAWRRAMSVTR